MRPPNFHHGLLARNIVSGFQPEAGHTVAQVTPLDLNASFGCRTMGWPGSDDKLAPLDLGSVPRRPAR